MDWFQSLVGFKEEGYARTRSKLAIEGEELVSLVNGRRFGVGRLELVRLAALRERVNLITNRRSTLRVVEGDCGIRQ